MRDGLVERDQGHRELHHVSVIRTASVGLLLAVALTGCGGEPSADRSERLDGRMVLVSGRDDHGMRAMELVPVYAAPASEERVGTVADGTLAHVAQVDGTWVRVVTAEGSPVDGWVDDFFLRGVVHLVGPEPSCRARVDGRPVTPGLQVVVRGLRGREVLVSGVADPSFRGRVPRSVVQELAPQAPHCGEDPPGAGHGH